jgi:hypothetical protein
MPKLTCRSINETSVTNRILLLFIASGSRLLARLWPAFAEGTRTAAITKDREAGISLAGKGTQRQEQTTEKQASA